MDGTSASETGNGSSPLSRCGSAPVHLLNGCSLRFGTAQSGWPNVLPSLLLTRRSEFSVQTSKSTQSPAVTAQGRTPNTTGVVQPLKGGTKGWQSLARLN